MATVLLALGGALGTAGLAVLGGRLWAQLRKLHHDVAVGDEKLTRVAAARKPLSSVVRSQQNAHDR